MRPNPEIAPFQPNPVIRTRLVIQNGTVTTNSTTSIDLSASCVNSKRTYSSVRTANFKALARQRKQLPINPYWSLVSNYSGTAYAKYLNGYNLTSGKLEYVETDKYSNTFAINSYQPFAGHVAEASDRALKRASQEASGLSVNLAEAFAERTQTARMMADTVWRIARAARELRRGNLYGAYNELSMSKGLSHRQERRIINTDPSKRLANFWLELQYGWKPLLQDVHDAAELLAKHIETDPWHSVIHGSASATQIVHDFDKEDVNVSTGKETRKTTARYTIFVSLDSASRSILAQTGISNPLLLGWELLPYSFVVDWFIPVGNYLESLGNFDGWIFQGGKLTQKTEMKYDRSFGRNVQIKSDRRYELNTTGSVRGRSFRFDRTILTSFPSANFGRLKSLDEALSPLHFANGLALLRQVFGR